ncbi:nickel pincer cofactor biosynthesis protein LarC [Solidesulfovibrio sp. C21]|uniref:nickel pincer cofactor biosynthesis protein LarC n=1 Tax=Solidesulfovibrio sp. C21 TaxID=3398613 RepID=UPI0039FDB2BE
MRILYYDCQAGISGDMNLAAMIDLGVDPDFLRAELSKLGLDTEFSLRVTRDARNGITGTRVDVELAGEQPADHDHQPGHVHEHTHGEHGHAHEHHDHEHDHGHEHHHDHGQRNLAAIEAIIEVSGLGEDVRRTSLAIFGRIAAAEAKVHGKPIEEVHFHEVGAVDSIVDIVGAAICFHALGVDAVWASPVELGGGFVRCAHGLIPVPAPATVEITTGIPTTRGAVQEEMATPTGAAIVATLADRFTVTPQMTVAKTGYGVGHRVTELPNLLRVHLAEADASDWSVSEARLLQCNIDDMTAELLGAAMDTLMEAGAMDVHFTPIIMKKNRPATCLSLLCAAADEGRFMELLFRHTTTLGIKSLPLKKTFLTTTFTTLPTPLGPVRLKNALLGGTVLRSKPEFEDCRALAREHNIPLAEVYALIGRCRAKDA